MNRNFEDQERVMKSSRVTRVLAVPFTWVFALSMCATHLQAQVITTVAGTEFVYPNRPLPALKAPLGVISGLAFDTAGNLYIADPSNQLVFKMDRPGVVTAFTGNGTVGFSGDGGIATSAALNLGYVNFPPGHITYGNVSGGLATDSAGNLFIADTGNHRVRKVSPSRVITTIAGNGQQGFSGDGAAAALASLNNPASVAVDTAGNVFIADTGNVRVRKVSPSGIISTVAGNGVYDNSQSGPASQSPMYPPSGIAVDQAGSLYMGLIVNSGGALGTVSASGVLSLIPLPVVSCSPFIQGSLAFDQSGNLFFAGSCSAVFEMTTNGVFLPAPVAGGGSSPGEGIGEGFSGDGGPATAALLNGPLGLAADSMGNFFIADSANFRLRRVSTTGIINTVAGSGGYNYGGDGTAAVSANLSSPQGVAPDPAFRLLIADTVNNRIRQVGPDGIISTLAGTGAFNFSGDGGPAIAATLRQPYKVAGGLAGDVLIADSVNGRVRRVNSAGVISTVIGGGWSVAADANGDVFSSDPNGVYKVAPNGAATTLVTGIFAYDISSDLAGNVLVAGGFGDSTVRRLTTAGVIQVIAGNGGPGFSGDGGPATTSSLNSPSGVAMDGAGNIYIADSQNHRVRKVTPDGVINTFAGTGTAAFSGDGGPATSAALK
jgi:sugar lactone lactonase YvrE